MTYSFPPRSSSIRNICTVSGLISASAAGDAGRDAGETVTEQIRGVHAENDVEHDFLLWAGPRLFGAVTQPDGGVSADIGGARWARDQRLLLYAARRQFAAEQPGGG